MASGEFSTGSIGDILTPASSVCTLESCPQTTETEHKKRPRGRLSAGAEDQMGGSDEEPVHQVDDLA